MRHEMPTATMSLRDARTMAGSVSTGNSKMPGPTYGLPTSACNIGKKLREIAGSTCDVCYAIRLEAFRANIRKRNERNLAAWDAAGAPTWIASMVLQIVAGVLETGQPYHRWFDFGDLQGIEMLRAIAAVARQTPHVRHWLPTREAALVKQHLEEDGPFPANLVVRVSAVMVGDDPIVGYGHTSTVHFPDEEAVGVTCQARTRKNKCGDCRACWNPEIWNVSYPRH